MWLGKVLIEMENKVTKELEKNLELLERFIFGDDCKGKMSTDVILSINKSYSDDSELDSAIRVRNLIKWILRLEDNL